jgi:hypothetical protein
MVKQLQVSEDAQLLRMLPVGQYEYVDVSFVMADTDTVISYTNLRAENPESIRWIDITPSTGRVYRAADPNKTTWNSGYVILRSTAIGSTRLLLFVERT